MEQVGFHPSDVFHLSCKTSCSIYLFFFPLASDVCCMGAQSLIIGVLQVQNGTLSLRIMAGLDFINE
jgi:hypothetical protein